MDYRILGPLEVCDGDRTLELGGDKQRALLAVLLLHAGEVVSADRLIDDLWGERQPPAALKALQAHISRLRKTLDTNAAGWLEAGGDPSAGSSKGVLVTRGHGYLLRVAPSELDLDRFRGLVEQGRRALAAGDPREAGRVLRAGLAMWRGPPLADFTYEAFAQAAIAQLEELHLGAVEERVEADLALGRHDQLVGELAALVDRNPLRERLRAQLMLALYRCGRQAEALDVYQEFRRHLSEELGLDPGPRLQQLEAAILSRDASLAAPVADWPPAEPAASAAPRRRATLERRRQRLAFGGLMLTGVAVAAAVLVSSGGQAARLSVIAADSVGAISPARGAISAVVPVGSSPSRLAAGEGAVWVTNYNDNTVSRIDLATRAVDQTIQAGSTPSGIAVGARAVWVANNFAGTVSKIDPAADRIVQSIPVGNGPSGVAVGAGSVWVTNNSDGTLSRINVTTGTVVKTIALGGGATDVAAGPGAVWVSDEANGRVLRVDPTTNQLVQAINVGTGPTAIALGYGSVWVANSLDGTVWRIDPQTTHVRAAIEVGNTPNAITVGAGGVWVANEYGGSVARIDPATDEVARTITVGNRPQGLAAAAGLVWVGAQASAASHRGGTLTVLQHGPLGSLDPTVAGSLASILTLYMTNDGLTAFKRVGGSDGAQVVPDLAISLPVPTDGGRTYTFQLRPGIRYSNGKPVRPEDFRHAIERELKLGPGSPFGGAWPYYENVVGGAACVAGPARCDLSRGIVTDDGANTIRFHLVSPDPEFPARLATWAADAVPTGTPNHNIGSHPLPATGPYEIASYTPRQLTLVRNPYFHEWSHAAQPDGYADRIVWRIGASTEAAVTAVERGGADYTLDPPPANRLNELQTRFASQLKVNLNDVTISMPLNTRVSPFTDLRVRQALNYAVDRAKLATLLGQESRPTCQQLPPYIPGYERYCPYTLNPNRAGVWSAPDLPKAQALIAASGTRGTPVTIWSTSGCYLTDFTAAGRYLVSLLDRLGYPTRIKTFPDPNHMFSLFADSRTRAQAALCVLAPNYPAASEFLGPLGNSCQSFVPNTQNNNNILEFCDRQFDATVRSALAAEATRSPTATQLWAKADRQFTDQAPVVQLDTPSITDFVSHRVGDYEYNPQLGVLIDQLWVH
jgi:YVTN family beta-propeller protein